MTEVRGSQDIETMIRIREDLSIGSFYFAEIVSDLKITYNHQHFIRKINIAKDKQAFLAEGKTLGQSDNEALIKNEEAYNEQLETEGNSYKADILLRQTNKVLEAMSQTISYLKIENRETKNQ
jgi:hypothetical protein